MGGCNLNRNLELSPIADVIPSKAVEAWPINLSEQECAEEVDEVF